MSTNLTPSPSREPEEYPIVKLTMTFRVTDPEALMGFASEAYEKAWQEHASFDSLAEAVFEAVGPSSHNPDFATMGLERIEQPEADYEQIDGPGVPHGPDFYEACVACQGLVWLPGDACDGHPHREADQPFDPKPGSPFYEQWQRHLKEGGPSPLVRVERTADGEVMTCLQCRGPVTDRAVGCPPCSAPKTSEEQTDA